MSAHFDNSYARMPERFFTPIPPTPVREPHLIRVNEPLARQLGFDPAELTADVVTGNALLSGSAPIATVYAGHQFGRFNPQLGDGRALLLGEVLDVDGARYDVQLKGSGRTPYSRSGDGRAPLGPVLREYIVAEAMHALGVPTSRALAAATTGEAVVRDAALPGAVLVRVASSHLRVGTIEYFAAKDDLDGVRALVDHVLQRHNFEVTDDGPAISLLTAVIERQAKLVAQWQLLGFIHGVMNTDNVLLCGETIDYGPCAFLDTFVADQVYSSIDQHGRYAFSQQPHIMHWNMATLARALSVLFEDDESQMQRAQDVLDTFPEQFHAAYQAGFARKLGLSTVEMPLALELLEAMERGALDHTTTWRTLTAVHRGDEEVPAPLATWAVAWRDALARDPQTPAEQQALMAASNPAIIPRNHQIEAAIQEATAGDFSRFERLTTALQTPFVPAEEFMSPPSLDEVVEKTFCGT